MYEQYIERRKEMCHPGQSGHLPCTANEKHGDVGRDEHLVFCSG